MSQIAIKKLAGRTRRGWVTSQILRSIFTGEFRGGDRLVEEEIAATLGVSRTPVREAFGELAAIGLIEVKPNHGAIVRPFGPTQIREMYHVRMLLEAEATRMAADRIEPGALRAIREKNQFFLNQPRSANWLTEMLQLDSEFHELIANSCGSSRLAEEIGRYRNLVTSIREAVGNIAQAQDVALLEHTQVVELLLARDADGAAKAMSDHIRRGTEKAINALFSNTREKVNSPGETDRTAPAAPTL